MEIDSLNTSDELPATQKPVTAELAIPPSREPLQGKWSQWTSQEEETPSYDRSQKPAKMSPVSPNSFDKGKITQSRTSGETNSKFLSFSSGT